MKPTCQCILQISFAVFLFSCVDNSIRERKLVLDDFYIRDDVFDSISKYQKIYKQDEYNLITQLHIENDNRYIRFKFSITCNDQYLRVPDAVTKVNGSIVYIYCNLRLFMKENSEWIKNETFKDENKDTCHLNHPWRQLVFDWVEYKIISSQRCLNPNVLIADSIPFLPPKNKKK